ncbi:MAG: rhomboid family intramembrane serine protease, partial [Lewinella sp.]
VMFGPLLERRYGGQRFLILYLVAAAGAVALHFGWTWYEINSMENIVENFRSNPTLSAFSDFFASIDTKSLTMDDGTPVSQVVGDIKTELTLNSDDPERIRQDAVIMMQEYIEFKTNVPMVGASGALYGVVAAFAILYPSFPLMLIFLPIPIRAKIFVPILLAVDLFLGVMQFSWDPIAHFAHLGGALAGGLLAYIWYKADPPAGAQRWDGGVPR